MSRTRRKGNGRAHGRRHAQGRFRPGPDPRRHVFRTEERRRGYETTLFKSAGEGWVDQFLARIRKYYRTLGRWHQRSYPSEIDISV
jgi:hypothetical protein